MKWKMANEHRAFSYTPFTHTIKLEADMLFTQSTDWWWDILCQHDMVFSYNCLNYKDEIIKQTPYRKLFEQNSLPNIYNGLTYFRRSKRAQEFYDICQNLTLNWQETKNKFLINCHDEEPTTDIIYSLALKIQDPLQENKIDYAWFKFIHGKPFINKIPGNMEQYNYLYPYKINKKTYLGGKSIDRIWHYHDKNMIDTLYDRVF